VAYERKGLKKHKDEISRLAPRRTRQVRTAYYNPDEFYLERNGGLAQLKRDDEAKARFGQYVRTKPPKIPTASGHSDYISRPELARARMVPAAPYATDGQGLHGRLARGKCAARFLGHWMRT